MSSEVADISGNGYLDIFISNIYYDGSYSNDYAGRTDGNNLLLNKGAGIFLDRANEYGVRKTAWGWATEIADFDNSGKQDIYQTTMSLFGDKQTFFFERSEKKSFVHRGAKETGIKPSVVMGASAIDYDNDGALDIVDTGLVDGGFRLYENNRDSNNSLRVDLNSTKQDLGSKVTVDYGNRTMTRFRTSGTDYSSQSPRILHFGLGNRQVADEVRIKWPDGTVGTFENVTANQTISVLNESDYRTLTEVN
jgi:hypothetical protein